MTHTKRSKLTFSRAFTLEGAECSFPAGVYELVTDEELIEGLSFPAHRRVASWILSPMQSSNSLTEMIMVDPVELAAAHARDVAGVNSPDECVMPAEISKAK